MKQFEAVAEAMRRNGGFATLGDLYRIVPDIADCVWVTKTPFASIRRIVQTHSELFFRIEPGLWALVSHKAQVLDALGIQPAISPARVDDFGHSYYQGLVVQIGNTLGYSTCVPSQDRNKGFLGVTLGGVASLGQMPPFTYERLVARAKNVDVTWLNARDLPAAFFEIEHSTDITTSLLKFLDLQDFRTQFYIVGHRVRSQEFRSKMGYSAFLPIRDFVRFMDYDSVSQLHTKTAESALIKQQCGL